MFFRPVGFHELLELFIGFLSRWLLAEQEHEVLGAVHHAKVLALYQLQPHRVPVEVR